MVNIVDFIANYNLALKAKHRMFSVKRTRAHLSFAVFLKNAGFVLGFHVHSSRIFVYPSYLSMQPTSIKSVSTASRLVFFGPHKIRASLRSGVVFILYSNGLFHTSYQCLLGNRGGLAVARFF